MRMKIWCVVLVVLGCCAASIAGEPAGYSRLEYAAPAADNGEIVVDFSNEDSVSAIDRLLLGAGAKESDYSWFSRQERWIRLRNVTSSLLQKLKSAPDVEEVEPNYYYSALFVPNDPYYKYQWHLDQIGMKRAWDYPAGGPVTVAVIDTGIAYEAGEGSVAVEDLGRSQFVKPYNFVDGNDRAGDDHGHGTHVAGTIAQLTNNGVGVAGVAPFAKLMPLKVLNASGYGTLADVAAAIRYAADNGAKVINLSLGGPFPSRILHKAIRYAHDQGVTIVCAAGNNGSSGLSYPAAYPECISVSAVRYDGTLTWYSSYGPGLTLAAPGGDMRVDQNGDGLMDGVLQNTLDPQDRSKQGYFLFQGTSMAAPHVAAAAALLVSQGVTDPDDVRDCLVRTATAVKGGDRDRYGAGIVNAADALEDAFLKRKVKIGVVALALVLALLALLNRGRSRDERVPMNALAWLGLFLGSTGFFFLGFIPQARDSFFLTHSLLEWPLRLTASAFSNPITLSALPALVLVMLFHPWKKLTPFLVAFCISAAVFLGAQVVSPTINVSWLPGRVLDSAWLLFHAGLSLLTGMAASFRVK